MWRHHSCTPRGPEAFPRESAEQTTQPVRQSPPSRREAENEAGIPWLPPPHPIHRLSLLSAFDDRRLVCSMLPFRAGRRILDAAHWSEGLTPPQKLSHRSGSSVPVHSTLISPSDPLAGTSTWTRMRSVCWERLSDRTSGSELHSFQTCQVVAHCAPEIQITKTLQTSRLARKAVIIPGESSRI